MNEGLAVFALPNEAAALVSGKGEGMTRYFMLQTLRSATGKTTTLSDFKSLRGEVRKLLGDGASAEGIKKEANDALKKSGNADISIGKLKPLGVVEELQDSLWSTGVSFVDINNDGLADVADSAAARRTPQQLKTAQDLAVAFKHTSLHVPTFNRLALRPQTGLLKVAQGSALQELIP